MSGLTWLHISDWHQEGKIFNAKVVCDELVSDIKSRAKISPDLEKIDFIVFSGDAAQSGKAEQYDEAFEKFFKPILNACKVSPEFLFVVPGNHDQDRTAIHPDLLRIEENKYDIDSWWNEDEKRSKVLQPFQAFNDFKQKHLGQAQAKYAETRLWEIDRKKIALLGTNSAWMCALHEDENGNIIDQGNLCVAESQIYEPLKEIFEADIRIAVLHHPLDWLAPFDRNSIELRLNKNFNFILHGHGHKPGASSTEDTFGYHITIPAGACYDRSSPPDANYVFSYNYVHLDFDRDECTVYFRSWDEWNRTWWKGDRICNNGKKSFPIHGPAIPHQIHSPRSDFTGCDEELKDLLTNFQKGVIIAGIQGLGGIGKTELAYKLAQELKELYPDGQILVELEGTKEKSLTPEQAMSKVIYALDRRTALPDDDAELVNLYHQKLYGKRVLLLLDNASDEQQVKPLLPPPTCGLIVTSRLEITLNDMKAINLEKMKPEKAVELLKRIMKTNRPLEAERCKEATWIEIARLCGHLPLALCAAGSMLANTRDLSPLDYAGQLQDEHTRLERIGSHGVDLDVEACFNLSYSRLTAEIASVFRKLSIFPLDFDSEAEATICQDQEHKHLSELLRWNLVEFQDDSGRYRLHELVKIFASSRLETLAKTKALRRHAEHYGNVLSSATQLYIKGNQLDALRKFDAEWINIQAGWTWAKQNYKGDNLAASLCSAYLNWPFLLYLRLHPREMISWLETGLAASRKHKDRIMECVHLSNLGESYIVLGEAKKAIEIYEQALVITRETGDRHKEGAVLGNLGIAYKDLGDAKRAIEFYEQALVIVRETGDRHGEGNTLGNLGNSYIELGDAKKAIEFCEQHLVIAREIGDRHGEGYSLGNLGNSYIELGDAKKAIEFYEQALIIAREIGDRRGEGISLDNLGNSYIELGDAKKAIEFYEQALVIDREIGYSREEGNTLWNMSLSLDRLGQRAKAIDCAKSALKIYEQIESPTAEKVRQKLAKWQKQ